MAGGNWLSARLVRNDRTMPSEDLRTRLRQQLRVAVRERDRIAVSALRDAIAALDNLEAVQPVDDGTNVSSQYVAGGVVGLGAAEAERRVLDPESQRAILSAEVESRLAAASTYEGHGVRRRATECRGTSGGA
jgi:uncharacterized protein